MLASRLSTVSARHTSRGFQRPVQRAIVIPRGLKENVQALPSVDGIQKVVLQPMNHTIPNQEGKKASVAIYAHLAQKYGGTLSEAAANEGLSLYAEVVEDARSHPGSHPNIDILFNVLAQPDVQVTIQVDKQ